MYKYIRKSDDPSFVNSLPVLADGCEDEAAWGWAGREGGGGRLGGAPGRGGFGLSGFCVKDVSMSMQVYSWAHWWQ